MGSKRCQFKKCYLPENNNRFFWQFAYLVVSLAVMLKESQQFNFLSLFLYTVPILFDLWNSDMENPLLVMVKRGFLLVNFMLCICVVLGFAGVIEDGGDCFRIVQSSLVLAGVQIKKVHLLWIFVPDLIIPLMLYYGSPCQKNAKAMKVVKEVDQEARTNMKVRGV